MAMPRVHDQEAAPVADADHGMGEASQGRQARSFPASEEPGRRPLRRIASATRNSRRQRRVVKRNGEGIAADPLDRPGRPLLRAAMPYQPKGRAGIYVNGLHGDPGATRWPPEIARMMRLVYKLDRLVATYEVSEPGKAHSYRLRASALLVQVEVGKRLQLASEISERRRARPHIQSSEY
jgi:hypothetical protein